MNQRTLIPNSAALLAKAIPPDPPPIMSKSNVFVAIFTNVNNYDEECNKTTTAAITTVAVLPTQCESVAGWLQYHSAGGTCSGGATQC